VKLDTLPPLSHLLATLHQKQVSPGEVVAKLAQRGRCRRATTPRK